MSVQLNELVGSHLEASGAVKAADSEFTKAATALMQQSLELVQDSTDQLQRMAVYPLKETLASGSVDKLKARPHLLLRRPGL